MRLIKRALKQQGPAASAGVDSADVGDADVGGAAANKRSLKPSVLLLRKA